MPTIKKGNIGRESTSPREHFDYRVNCLAKLYTKMWVGINNLKGFSPSVFIQNVINNKGQEGTKPRSVKSRAPTMLKVKRQTYISY